MSLLEVTSKLYTPHLEQICIRPEPSRHVRINLWAQRFGRFESLGRFEEKNYIICKENIQ